VKFPASLRAAREKLGVSRVELADKSGLSVATIEGIELKGTLPSLATYYRLCEALKISPGPILSAK
jgi:transcriptional regulator with XRE-family HTH domain